MILQQPIEREQMKKLLETGRTDLLTGFVSKKGRRFKAFLVKQPGGKIGFEFQARAEKPRKGQSTTKAVDVAATPAKETTEVPKKKNAPAKKLSGSAKERKRAL
jgi:DNA topoisomerase-3